MNKHLFQRKATVVSVIGTSSLILILGISSAQATTQDTAQTSSLGESRKLPTASTKEFNQNPWSNRASRSPVSGFQVSPEIQDFINDVSSFVQGDLFGGMAQTIQKTLGSVQVPDLGLVVSQIMKGSVPEDVQIATQLENNIPNAYALRQDAASMSQRVGALQVAQAQTLSLAAQEQSKATLDSSAASAAQSTQMAQDSQNSDTSQHILQNISNQLKNQATIANLQMKEASQARQDRALQLTLTAQAASELNAANIKDRQTTISAGNAAAAQGALLFMPGGAVLGQKSD